MKGQAVTCCEDLASDIRDLVRKRLEMREHMPDFDKDDIAEFELLGEQIKSLMSLEIVEYGNEDTVYVVGDYVTQRQKQKAIERETFKKSRMMEFIRQTFH